MEYSGEHHVWNSVERNAVERERERERNIQLYATERNFAGSREPNAERCFHAVGHGELQRGDSLRHDCGGQGCSKYWGVRKHR